MTLSCPSTFESFAEAQDKVAGGVAMLLVYLLSTAHRADASFDTATSRPLQMLDHDQASLT
jgi:hypothetical protein